MSRPRAAPPFERVIGRHVGPLPGPTLIVCGALHGNEPAGVLAAQRVSHALDNLTLPLRGEWMAITGNVQALRQEKRFLTFDLNRCWTEPEVRAMLFRDPGLDNPEQAEQRSLVNLLGEAAERARGDLVLFDLHTTSGESPPFLVLSDSLRNRDVAAGMPGTVILGLEEAIDGTLLEYMSQLGHRGVVVESGQHAAVSAIEFHESYIWIGMAAAGMLDPADVPGYADHRRRLVEAGRHSPRVVEVLDRHDVQPGDGFRMRPGYKSFQPIAAGEHVADRDDGPVNAPRDGMILMPLYQPQGNDGFFVVRNVHRFWLRLSRVLRTLKLSWLLPLLPGVRRDPDRRDALRVDKRVARFYAVQIFHLFGYRRRRQEGDVLVFTRRR